MIYNTLVWLFTILSLWFTFRRTRNYYCIDDITRLVRCHSISHTMNETTMRAKNLLIIKSYLPRTNYRCRNRLEWMPAIWCKSCTWWNRWISIRWNFPESSGFSLRIRCTWLLISCCRVARKETTCPVFCISKLPAII